jgi:hypothetical protein
MQALFAHLKAAAVIDFTADAEASSSTLTDVDRADLLFPGLPVFGPGLVEGVVIDSVDVEAGTVTLSEPVASGGASLDFSTGFLSADTRVLHWQQVDAQPALFLRRTGVLDQVDAENFFSITTLECEAWIYCNAGQNPDAKPDDTLTALEKLVRELRPRWRLWRSALHLGGLAHWCRIQGKTDVSSGDQGPQAIVRIPILVTLP